MEGFLNIRLRPWLRRLITRLIAIVPAVIVAIFYGESGTAQAAHPQPGDSQPAALVRGLPAGRVHVGQAQDGRVREPDLAQGARVDASRSSSRALNVWLLVQIVPRIWIDADVQTHPRPARALGVRRRRSSSTCASSRASASASIVLIHVADGWAARNVKQLDLRESEEMQARPRVLEATCATLERDGLRGRVRPRRRRSGEGDRGAARSASSAT